MTLHKNIDTIAATPLAAGHGVSMKMLLSPDELLLEGAHFRNLRRVDPLRKM